MLALPEYPRTQGSYNWEYGDECESCGCRHPYLHRDHKLPRYKGGTDDPDNMQLICPNCHSIKTVLDIKGRKSPFSGRHHTPESKQKIREGKLRSKYSPAVLTEEAVLEIRKLSEDGATNTQIARVCNVSIKCICDIVNRHTWTNI